MQHAQRPFFLLSFLPALAYWYLETYHTLEVALVGGVLLGGIEILVEKRFSDHVHTLSKLNLALVVILGGISFVAREGIFFKLQPTFTGFAIAGFLIYKKIRRQSLMVEMLKDMQQKLPLPETMYRMLEWHLCLFLMGFALFMAYVAMRETTSTWLFWKTGGFYMAFGAFTILEMVYLRITLRSLRS